MEKIFKIDNIRFEFSDIEYEKAKTHLFLEEKDAIYNQRYQNVKNSILKAYQKDCTQEGYFDNLIEVINQNVINLHIKMKQDLHFKGVDSIEISDEYSQKVVNLIESLINPIEEAYCEILADAAGEKIYREVRKSSRGRWSGGGFGLSGALKGAAMAGSMNMATGMAHSAFNFVGNTKTNMKMRKMLRDLFNDNVKKIILKYMEQIVDWVEEEYTDILIKAGKIIECYEEEEFERTKKIAKFLTQKEDVTLQMWGELLKKIHFVKKHI